MREATRGMSGGGTPTRSNSGISPVAGPTFPQPGLGPSAGRGTPGLFPGLESPLGETSPIDTRGGLTPGRFDPFRSTGTGSGPTFPGGSPMQPGFPGSDPSRPTFPGASPAVGPSQMGSSGLDPFSPEIRPGGGPPGRAVSGLMGARPLGQPPRFPGSLASGPGGRSSFTDPMTGGPPMPGGPTGMDTPFPGSGASGPGGPPGAGDGTPRPIGEASLIMSDASGIYYNFYAYSGSDAIRVTISKTGFCRPPIRIPSGSVWCEEECRNDNRCPGAQKCCPVGLCSLGCAEPRLDVPGP